MKAFKGLLLLSAAAALSTTGAQARSKAAPPIRAEATAVRPAEFTALDRYVARPDPAYKWSLAKTIPGPGYTTFVLALTSQTWRKPSEVDKPLWTHWLTVVRPDQVSTDKALLYITGGTNTDPAPDKAAERNIRLATETHSIVAELSNVPNQPLRFSDSPDVPRVEDDIISHVAIKQLKTGAGEWMVRFPMVKSGVRAMDALQAFAASDAGGRHRINGFVVAGGSKRGWTTWLVGAVDKRVVAIMPIVIDVLNTDAVTRHHWKALGYFSPALKDYVNAGIIPQLVGKPELQKVQGVEDPYNYRHRGRLRIPKYLINASGDQFFLPDNSQFYYGDLPEEKRLRYVPNAKHDLGGSDVADSMVSFYQSVISGVPRPRYSWSKGRDGTLTVRTPDRPREVKLWQATNPKARDFRVDTIGRAYTATTLQPRPDGSYVARPDKPASGWTAYFVELTYDGPGGPTAAPFKFTTEVAVTPDVLPYKWKDAVPRTSLPGGG